MAFSKNTFLVLFLVLSLVPASCRQAQEPDSPADKLNVIATIFPLYDFARVIGADKVSVTMLLPPGVDAHNYELKPDDILQASRADVFLFMHFEMEQWAYKITGAATEKSDSLAIEAGEGTALLRLPRHLHTDGKGHGNHSTRFDPHTWLDFDNAQKIVDNITATFISKDLKNSDYYKANAREYKTQLKELDKKYRRELADCESRIILHAGHWAFAYLAKKYNLKYMAAYSASAEAEPLPHNVFSIIELINDMELKYIFYEDLVAPRLAQTIARETDVGMLKLNNGHDISKDDLKKGITFLGLMENNLSNLKKGLSCR
ncbi:MAG TPA: zinc-binding protein [Deltaproteobacteria bacterium]|nr:zinc-binding protein [Deltaproteobacteria bacterium]